MDKLARLKVALEGPSREQLLNEIEKLLAEIEKRFGVNWGFNYSGRQPGSRFIQAGKGVIINPGKWQAFKQEKLKRSRKQK